MEMPEILFGREYLAVAVDTLPHGSMGMDFMAKPFVPGGKQAIRRLSVLK